MELRFKSADVDRALRGIAEIMAPGFKATDVKWRNGVAIVELAGDQAVPAPSAPIARAVSDRSAGYGEFRVRLISSGHQKIAVIKCIRHWTGAGLKEAKDASEALPFVFHFSSRLKAEEFREDLQQNGARAELI
jgi:ribosomal protein L7/L12